MVLRRTEMNFEANGARAGEGDEAGLRMLDDSIAERGSGAGAKIDHAIGHAGLFEDLDKARSDGGRVARWLEDHCIAGDDSGSRHSGHDGEGEVPGRNHRTYAERNVKKLVALAGILNGSRGPGQAQRFARVELKEVDRLAHVRVGFGPVLANLVDEPSHELKSALVNDFSRSQQE